jgi:post-segregation antitoxin (ccd killing protein)
MSTLSFHADQNLEKEIRHQARARKIPVSRYLKETIAQALSSTGKTGADVAGFLKGAGTLSPSESVLPPWTGTDSHLG